MKDNRLKNDIIMLVILIICLVVFVQCSVEDSRSDRNMVYIEEGYCYDKNTKIIYINPIQEDMVLIQLILHIMILKEIYVNISMKSLYQ